MAVANWVKTFQSLVWWIRGFKAKVRGISFAPAVFQSLVWWIRGFKFTVAVLPAPEYACFNPWFGG